MTKEISESLEGHLAEGLIQSFAIDANRGSQHTFIKKLNDDVPILSYSADEIMANNYISSRLISGFQKVLKHFRYFDTDEKSVRKYLLEELERLFDFAKRTE